MKGGIYVVTIFLLMKFNLNGQIEHLKTLSCEALCTMIESNDGFAIKDISVIENNIKDAQGLRDIQMLHHNMLFRFSLPELEAEEYYVLDWVITIDTRKFRIAPEATSKHVIHANEQSKEYEVIWYAPLDQLPLGAGDFNVMLQARFFGLPCLFPQGKPQFGWKQQKYHAGVALIGGAMIGLAEVHFMSKARNDYDSYKDLVTTAPLEILSPQANAEAEDLLEQVRDNESSANFVRRSGQVIIAGSIVIYAIRYIKFKKDLRKWNRYCIESSPEIGWRPIYDSNVTGQSIGMALTFTF